ncbi:calcium-activated chloride channel regulator 4A-like [Oratosquilla oratoria]|uniref:calcium-activated chloride channel regulator 4A-like n=1 Tax=Oratosquilla oratoria TaxID=337810 RepID=UPI003F777849
MTESSAVLLRSWSTLIHEATNGRAALRSTTVLLPHRWSDIPRMCRTASTTPEVGGAKATSAHIRVEGPHPVFDSAPWTQQSRGCGHQGDFIQMGSGFLRPLNATGSAAANRAARLLLAEWAKFRWGVFSEKGHQGDPLYPLWYRSEANNHAWAPTVCSNGQVGGSGCNPDFSPDCVWSADPSHSNATSSILGLSHSSKVTQFCDSRSHNPEAQTKHNVLCNGRDVWHIMMMSPDFNFGRNPPSPSAPTPDIQFAFRARSRYVLLIEDTAVMNLQMSAIRALFLISLKFILGKGEGF